MMGFVDTMGHLIGTGRLAAPDSGPGEQTTKKKDFLQICTQYRAINGYLARKT